MAERELPYKCPNCGSSASLVVQTSAMATLFQDPDNIETEIYGDHEWDRKSYMRCGACDFDGWAKDFENPIYYGDSDD